MNDLVQKNWIKQLSESYIQMNEVKANIRGQYPFYKKHIGSETDPSLGAEFKRMNLKNSATVALNTDDHWVHHPKYDKIKTALINHVQGDTQQEDLEYLVNFMKMDQGYTEEEVRNAFVRNTPDMDFPL